MRAEVIVDERRTCGQTISYRAKLHKKNVGTMIHLPHGDDGGVHVLLLHVTGNSAPQDGTSINRKAWGVEKIRG